MPPPLTTTAQAADFIFRTPGLALDERDQLRVTAFTGREGVSELFRFRVDLVSTHPGLERESLLLNECHLEIVGDRGSRFVNGVIRRFERVGEGSSLTHYRAEIVPLHWLLGRRFDCRIFHEQTCADMTVPGIIAKVLTDAGVPPDRFDLGRLTPDGHAVREYVVQYRESDLNFISRLAEQEGIFYFFEHAERAHVMVFGDNPAVHRDVDERAPTAEAGRGVVAFRTPNGLVPESDVVFDLRACDQLVIGSVVLDDFNFRRPDLDLITNPARAGRHDGLRVYDCPGGYPDQATGAQFAQTVLQAHQCRRRVFRLKTTARNLEAGRRFAVVEHPEEEFNRQYLITRIRHRGEQRQSGEEEQLDGRGLRYEATVHAIPFGVWFRPKPVTPKPTVHGSQTAMVVAQANNADEIYVDNHGRVKVQFHWDHEQPAEDSSMFIRVSQGWAGAGWGMLFLPRVGQEVIVDFLEGDPDRPIITGRVYNGLSRPPLPLPQERTRSVIRTSTVGDPARYHMIRFEDRPHAEQLLIRAQGRMDTCVRGPHFHATGASLHESVGHGEKGQYFRTVHEKVHLHNLGPEFVKIDDARHEYVEGDALNYVNADYLLGVKGLIEMNAGKAILQMNDLLVLMVDESNYIAVHKEGIDIVGKRVRINCSGGANYAVREHDIAQPLDASGADCGGRSAARGGGGGAGRTQTHFHFVPQRTPAHPPDRGVTTLDQCSIETIVASCQHPGPLQRIALAGQTLDVVPSPGAAGDPIDLFANVSASCGLHPEWRITHQPPLLGIRQQFLAVPNDEPRLWIPLATPRPYNVSCVCCNGQAPSLTVRAFPGNRLDVNTRRRLPPAEQAFREALRKLRDTLHDNGPFQGIDFLEGDVSVLAHWAEWPDLSAFYKYKASFAYNPLVSVSIEGSITDLPGIGRLLSVFRVRSELLRKIMRYLNNALFIKITGQISLNAAFERSSPTQPLFSQTTTGGEVRNVFSGRVTVEIGGAGPGFPNDEVLSVEFGASGGVEAVGTPIVEARGFFLRNVAVNFTGLQGRLKVHTLLGDLINYGPAPLIDPFELFRVPELPLGGLPG